MSSSCKKVSKSNFMTKAMGAISWSLLLFLVACGNNAGCGLKKTVSQDVIQDNSVETRITKRGVDFFTSHLSDLVCQQLTCTNGKAEIPLPADFKLKADAISGLVKGRLGFTSDSKIVIDVDKLAKNMAIDFKRNNGLIQFTTNANEFHTLITVRLNKLDVNLKGSVYGDAKVLGFTSNVACPIEKAGFEGDLEIMMAVGINKDVDGDPSLSVRIPEFNDANLTTGILAGISGASQPTVGNFTNPRFENQDFSIGFYDPNDPAETSIVCNNPVDENADGNYDCADVSGIINDPPCVECENICGPLATAADFLDSQVLTLLENQIVSFIAPTVLNLLQDFLLSPFQGLKLNLGGELSIVDLIGQNGLLDIDGDMVKYTAGPMDTGLTVEDPTSKFLKALSIKMAAGLDSVFSPCIEVPEAGDRAMNNPKFVIGQALTDAMWGSKGTYHVGLNMAEGVINRTLYEIYHSGNLCIGVNSEAISGLLGQSIDATLLFGSTNLKNLKSVIDPSTGIYIQLKPEVAPYVTMSEVTKDPNLPAIPELKINLDKAEVSFYAYVEQRLSRVFSSHVGMEIPLRLEVNGTSQMLLTLDKINYTFPAASEDYREYIQGFDPSKGMKEILDLFLGFIVGGNGFSLPADFTSIVQQVMGPNIELRIKNLGLSGQGKDFLLILLEFAEKQATSSTPFFMVQAPEFRIDEESLYKWENDYRVPSGKINLQTPAINGIEYQFRINKGYWTHWTTKNDVSYENNLLNMPIRHRVDMRYRLSDKPWFIYESKPVFIKVDFDIADHADHLEKLQEKGILPDFNTKNESAPVTPSVKKGQVLNNADELAEDALGGCHLSPEIHSHEKKQSLTPGLLILAVFAMLFFARRKPRRKPSAKKSGKTMLVAFLMLSMSGFSCSDEDEVRGRTCSDEFTKCSADNDTCGQMTCGAGVENICRFKSCTGAGFCTYQDSNGNESQGVCLSGQCLPNLPCGFDGQSACSEDQACFINFAENLNVGKCVNPPTTATGCEASCASGQIKVIDYDVSSYTCETSSCSCITIDDVPGGLDDEKDDKPKVSTQRVNPGMHSDMVANYETGVFYVSNYHPLYGDVMLSIFEKKADDTVEEKEVYILDGKPANCKVLGNPTGFRGGCNEAGEDVGWYTAIDLDPTKKFLHITYYDKTNYSLKYVSFNVETKKAGTPELVDEGACLNKVGNDCIIANDIGLFSDVAVDEEGGIHVSYMANTLLNSNDKKVDTAIKYAKRTVTGKWKTLAIETTKRPNDDMRFPCAGQSCASNEACAVKGAFDVCIPKTRDCNKSCDPFTEICSSGVCYPKKPDEFTLTVPPRALGKGTSIAVRKTQINKMAIAYFDNTVGQLKLATSLANKGDNITSQDFTVAAIDGQVFDQGKAPCDKDADCGSDILSCNKEANKLWGFCEYKACKADSECGKDNKCFKTDVNNASGTCITPRKVILANAEFSCTTKDDICGYHKGFSCNVNSGYCEKEMQRKKVGDFPAMMIDKYGTIHITYFDFQQKALAYLKGEGIEELSEADVKMIDTGVIPGNLSFMGTESALIGGPDDSIIVVYQDATNNDILLSSTKADGPFTKPKNVFTESGVYGFYLSLGNVQGKIFLGHYHIQTQRQSASKVNDLSKYEIQLINQ